MATYLIDDLDKAHVAMQSKNVAVASYVADNEGTENALIAFNRPN